MLWLVDLIPDPVLASPERVLMSVAVLLIGISAFVPPPGSIVDLWPTWAQYEWAINMILAGSAGLATLWTGSRLQERFGALATMLGSGVYAFALVGHGTSRTISALIFGLLAVAGLIRYIRSTAFGAYVINKRAGHPHG